MIQREKIIGILHEVSISISIQQKDQKVAKERLSNCFRSQVTLILTLPVSVLQWVRIKTREVRYDRVHE